MTFNVKDFRAMLSLCEHLGRPLVMYMEGAGLPLVVEPGGEPGTGPPVVEAQLVLATLVEGQEGASQAPIEGPSEAHAGAGSHHAYS